MFCQLCSLSLHPALQELSAYGFMAFIGLNLRYSYGKLFMIAYIISRKPYYIACPRGIFTVILKKIIRPSFFQSVIFCHCYKPISDDLEDFDDDVRTESYCDCPIIGTSSCDKLFRKQNVISPLTLSKGRGLCQKPIS